MADIEHVAERVIVINHGTLIYDDSVDAMRRSLLRRKLVEVQLAGDAAELAIAGRDVERLSERGASGWSSTPSAARCGRCSTSCSTAYEVADISVVDPPLEDVIGRIYARPVDGIPG